MTTTDSNPNSGLSVVGSVAKTSMPAPATRPSAIADASASSSTMPPRATLMIRTVGLTLVSASLPMRPTVSAFLGRWTVMKSDSARSSSRPTSRAPTWPARWAET